MATEGRGGSDAPRTDPTAKRPPTLPVQRVETTVPANSPEVPVMPVAKGETWSFSASGRWWNGYLICGPDGYRNFLADAFQLAPRAAGHPWLKLMGQVKTPEGRLRAPFPIGAGATELFHEDGELAVFANDNLGGYATNSGSLRLEAVRGGVAPGDSAYGGWIGLWHSVRDVFARTAGIPVIAAFVFGVSAILIFMRQGRDLVRGVGEDNFLQRGSWLLQIAFAAGLLFLGLQAWSWSRLVVESNYGVDRTQWRPRAFLEWTPRILGAVPFIGSAIALWLTPAPNTWFVIALCLIGLVFFGLIVKRQDIRARMEVAGRRGIPLFQRYWVIFGLAGALIAMILATVWPVGFGAWLGAPAVVFLGLGFIIPPIVIAIQLGASLRVPVTSVFLLAAIVFGLWVDNHGVGRRAFATATSGPTDRMNLADAFALWSGQQPKDRKKTMALIAVQGGASRAGYWTAAALANLRDTALAPQEGKPGFDVASHIFAISSVSGGSVGAVGYAAMLKAYPNAPDFRLRLLRFAGQDGLGPAMTGMLFPDLLQRFLPVTFLPDRAETLERSWEDAWAQIDPASPASTIMSQPFLNLAPKANEAWRPILIVQGASENSGRRVLTSGVAFNCDEVDADDFFEGVGHDVAASTAILNGARFPFVSPGGTFQNFQLPAGRCKKDGSPKVSDHILDGGYFDGAGAETLREMIHAIRAMPGGSADVLDIMVVLIGYRDPNAANPTPALAINDVFAPFFGLYSSMPAHEEHLAREMKLEGEPPGADGDPYTSRAADSDLDYQALVLCKGQIEAGGALKDYEPPMDWTLSGEAKRYIENALIASTHACDAQNNARAVKAIVAKLRG